MDEGVQGNIRGRQWVVAGASSAFLAVAFGAFGAHMVRERIPADRFDIFQTAAQYHLIHSIALIVIGILETALPPSGASRWVPRLILAGIIIFSGSLYLLAVTGIRALGAITPIGGVCFLSGWALLAVATLKRPRG